MTTSSLELKADLPTPVKDKLNTTKEAVQAKVDGLKQHLQKGSETAQGKAGEATLQARNAAHEALVKLPSPVSSRVEQLAGSVRQRPVPAAAVLLGVLVLLMLRRLLHGNR